MQKIYLFGTSFYKLSEKQGQQVDRLKELERLIEPGELLSVQVVAGRLEVSVRTVYKYIKDKKLEAVRIGRLWRIPTAAYFAFVYGNALDHLGIVESRFEAWDKTHSDVRGLQ